MITIKAAVFGVVMMSVACSAASGMLFYQVGHLDGVRWCHQLIIKGVK